MAAEDRETLTETESRRRLERHTKRIALRRLGEALSCTQPLCTNENFLGRLAGAQEHLTGCLQTMEICSRCKTITAVITEHFNIHNNPEDPSRNDDDQDLEERPSNKAIGVMILLSIIFSVGASYFYVNYTEKESKPYIRFFVFLNLASKAIFVIKNKEKNQGVKKFTGTAVFGAFIIDFLIYLNTIAQMKKNEH